MMRRSYSYHRSAPASHSLNRRDNSTFVVNDNSLNQTIQTGNSGSIDASFLSTQDPAAPLIFSMATDPNIVNAVRASQDFSALVNILSPRQDNYARILGSQSSNSISSMAENEDEVYEPENAFDEVVKVVCEHCKHTVDTVYHTQTQNKAVDDIGNSGVLPVDDVAENKANDDSFFTKMKDPLYVVCAVVVALVALQSLSVVAKFLPNLTTGAAKWLRKATFR